MKTKFLFLLLLISSYAFSQSVNDYAAVIIPLKYDFLKSENQYRLCTLTKVNLKKAGFEAFYVNEDIPAEYSNRCSLLNVDLLRENGFLVTKLYVVFKDCNGKVVFKSEVGKSKEKDYEVAYTEALNMAFASVYALQYKYNGGAVANSHNVTAVSPVMAPVASTAVVATTAAVAVNVSNATESDGVVLFAQPIKNGFQLVDTTPKVVMKAYKTTNPSIYLASKENIQGVMVLKENQWFFEYYEKETLMSEKIIVKF
ncbi:MAG TPA: hypothetical protein VFS71_07275 [Flavobacterium sp.]|uniref:hypothetical protein n=1 Tax=Flavobacterium sp. TaxID=239 RepID=UPI002DB60B63|nr:hypothetical protein [Flavobacterium sp.]HEU4789469.1 hypothetical protein [Flavobacterium sp.]